MILVYTFFVLFSVTFCFFAKYFNFSVSLSDLSMIIFLNIFLFLLICYKYCNSSEQPLNIICLFRFVYSVEVGGGEVMETMAP